MLKRLAVLVLALGVQGAHAADRSYQSVADCQAKVTMGWNFKVPPEQADATVKAFQAARNKCLDGSGKHRKMWEYLQNHPVEEGGDINITINNNTSVGYDNNPLRQGYEPINRTGAFGSTQRNPLSNPR